MSDLDMEEVKNHIAAMYQVPKRMLFGCSGEKSELDDYFDEFMESISDQYSRTSKETPNE